VSVPLSVVPRGVGTPKCRYPKCRYHEASVPRSDVPRNIVPRGVGTTRCRDPLLNTWWFLVKIDNFSRLAQIPRIDIRSLDQLADGLSQGKIHLTIFEPDSRMIKQLLAPTKLQAPVFQKLCKALRAYPPNLVSNLTDTINQMKKTNYARSAGYSQPYLTVLLLTVNCKLMDFKFKSSLLSIQNYQNLWQFQPLFQTEQGRTAKA